MYMYAPRIYFQVELFCWIDGSYGASIFSQRGPIGHSIPYFLGWHWENKNTSEKAFAVFSLEKINATGKNITSSSGAGALRSSGSQVLRFLGP